MSRYRIVLKEESRRNIDAICGWIAERSPDGARRWYRACLNAFDKRLDGADRLPIAPQKATVFFNDPLAG